MIAPLGEDLLSQFVSHSHPSAMDRDSVKHAVRPSKIDVLKNAWSVLSRFVGVGTLLLDYFAVVTEIDRFAGGEIADQFEPAPSQRDAL